MEKKEVKKWQDEEALKRYRMIAPLLDPDLDEGKRQQRPASRTKKRQQRLPENFEEIMGQAVQLKREVPRGACARS